MACKWMGIRSVLLLSSALEGMNEILSVQRREKGSKMKSSVPCPTFFKLYNCGKGGVDLMDQHTAAYRLDGKSSVRFYLHIFFDLMDIACVNSYITYKMKHPNHLSVPYFEIFVAKNLVQYHQGRKRIVPMSRQPKRKNQPELIDNHSHILSKGKKLFPKASNWGLYIIYALYIFAKTLWIFIWFLYISRNLFEFFICIIFYIYIVIFSVLCFERSKVVKEM